MSTISFLCLTLVSLSQPLSSHGAREVSSLLSHGLLASANGGERQSKTELEGVWLGVETASGEKSIRFKPGQVRLVFQGKKLLGTGIVSADERELVFTLRSDVSPKRFEYGLAGKPPVRCIYELKGETLRIGCSYSAKAPTQFSPNMAIMTLKRQ
jgi:uncharacterized protein (TIGR03067 family)